MLPLCRTSEDIFSIPKFELEGKEVQDFLLELKGFHDEFRDCFFRIQLREHFFQYMVGQFSELERKSIEPIALNVKDGKVRPMQRFISDSIWDETKLLSRYRNMINNDLGHTNGVLIFDETGFPKKGTESAGVARQFCGTIGKVDNCQVGVFSAYASPYGYSLLDKRLFLPEKWFSDTYADKREKCRIPEDLEFKTKPQLAVEMFQELLHHDTIPFKYVVADSIYGNSPDFIDAVESHPGLVYFVSVSSDTRCWLEEPITRMKKYKYGGEIRYKEVVESTDKKPISLMTLAESINNYFWYQRKVSEGTKGPIFYEFTRKRIILSKNGLPVKNVWLIIRRSMGSNPDYQFYISNAPDNTPIKIFVWLSSMRWAIEQCFEETKTEMGMDQYEVRKFTGWGHHMLICILGHFFLWHLKIRLGKKSTSYYGVAD